MSLTFHPNTDIPYVWGEYKDYIQQAVDRGSNYTLPQIFLELQKGNMQLWTYRDKAAAVTMIQTDNLCKFCLILALGGMDMDEWVNEVETIEAWARAYECKEMRIYGRRGWSRELGYRVDYTRMSKCLADPIK